MVVYLDFVRLGPLTGTFTLFNNTGRQPDSTKILIYILLYVSIPFSFFVPTSLISVCVLVLLSSMCTNIGFCFAAFLCVLISLCVQGCKLIETADQDLTDFTKCLAIMLEEIKVRQLQVKKKKHSHKTFIHTFELYLVFIF